MADAGLTQSAYWNGEVGMRWARNRRRLDAVFAPLTTALFAGAALRVDGPVLDIGCGAGDTAIAAARRVGAGGRVVAVDVSAPLLAIARERAEAEAAGAPITFVEADAQTHDFGGAVFEHAISRFGVMFFEDSVAAFANIRRALVPGGRLTLLCWRSLEENPWIAVPRGIVLPLVPAPEPSPPDAPGPFRFADREHLAGLLAEAGYREIAFVPVDAALALARSEEGSALTAAETAAAFVLELGPASRLLRDEPPHVRALAHAAVTRDFTARAEAGVVSLDAACWLVSAMR